MPDIYHHVGITAPADRVYEALATVDGLAGWWTRTTDGDASVGGQLRFYFGSPEPSAVMEVTALSPDEHVRWSCVSGPDEWVGTELTFDLSQSGEETMLRFSHAGWHEPIDFMAHCSTKWGYFLLGLKNGLEGGKATPYPEDMKISSWG
jgi:uncharacterized protein YndB with AHSA1/START domain